MECEKARDRFSSFLENELDAREEKTVREHLASCSDCQKDLEQLTKTLGWLHSVKDVEVPDGFLRELHKKMEEPKRKAPFLPLSLKLPAQAVAMVAIVCLVLYLTKIMPFDSFQEEGTEPMRPSLSEPLTEEKKADPLLAKKEMEEERGAPPFAEPSPAPLEKRKIEPALPALIAREKASPEVKPPQEVFLRTSDRKKTLNQIQTYLQQFDGKMIKVEGNVFLASLPAASLSEFEKKLAGLNPPEKTDHVFQEQRIAESDTAPAGAVKLRDQEQTKRSKVAAEQESHVLVRVVILEE
ncbi:MAG: zf-HC2 domain-containing protein [Thermodesulfobacteriota bacterium]